MLARTLITITILAPLAACHPVAHTHAPDDWVSHETDARPAEVWVPREHAAGLPLDIDSVEVMVPSRPR
jgi:hypothetical protein